MAAKVAKAKSIHCWALFVAVLVAQDQANAQSATNTSVSPLDRGECVRSPSTEAAMRACDQLIARTPEDADLYINRGNGWTRLNQWEKAETDFRKAAQLKPNYYRSHLGIGVVLAHKGDFDSAIAEYNEAIKLNPKDAASYANRGRAFIAKGEQNKALLDFDEAISLEPTLAIAYSSRGDILMKVRDYEKAIADYSEAIRRGQKSPNTYFNRGLALARKDQTDDAISDFSEAIALNPKNAVAYLNRGIGWIKKIQFEKAIEDFSAALAIDQNYMLAFANRGYAWAAKGDLDKAIADYGAAIAIDPKNTNAWVNRGNSWRRKGEHDKAMADYDEATKIDPKLASAYEGRGFALGERGEYDKAIANYNEATKLNPTNEVSYFNRGIMWGKKGELERAITDYTEAIKLNAKYAAAYSNRGNAWGKKGDYDKAIADQSEAIKLDPKKSVYYDNRGRSWSYKGDYRRAISDYSDAIKANPAFSVAFSNRGAAWQKLGSLDKAIEDYREALKLDPQNANVRERLQLVQEKQQREKVTPAVPTASNQVAPKTGQVGASTVATERRVALIIGNGRYKNVAPLENPTRDAELIARTLQNAGFSSVTIKLNLNRQQMLDALREFEKVSRGADWSIVYYAGHGIEVDGVNYMIPIDAKLTDQKTIASQTVNMEYLLNTAEVAKKMRLIILDACRNNPFIQQVERNTVSRSIDQLAETSSFGRGLARIEPAPGTLVVYAAKHGETALDGEGGNSPFVKALVNRIGNRPALEMRRLFDFVREDVFVATKKQQQPFSYGSLSAKDDFFFVK